LIWTFSKCLNLFEVPDFSQCGLWPLANASRALVEGNFAIDSALAPGHWHWALSWSQKVYFGHAGS